MVYAPSSQPNPGPFTVPEPAVARHPGALLAPRELRRWIDGLPLANPAKAAQMLLQQLRLLVRDPQPDARYAGLLQIYEPPVIQLLEFVDQRLRDSGDGVMPLDQLEYAMTDLLSELAYGHLRTANDLFGKGKPPPTEMLYRAMRLLDSALTIERLRYCRLTPATWRLFLQIHAQAQELGIAGEAVPRELRRGDDPPTIDGLFFRALVIDLCDPHHRRPADMLKWQAWTGRNTELLELTILPAGPFAIPVDTAGELAPLAGARRGKPGPEMRYLDAERFMQRLEEDPEAPEGLMPALRDLITGRKSPEQRQNPRQPRNHPFLLAYGLRNIHSRLDALTRGSGGRGQPAAPLACRQLNQSKSGAAFLLPGPINPPLGVDEPVLVEAEVTGDGGTPVGFAARIRRVVTRDDHSLEIGVEKLAGRLIPVVIGGSAGQRMRGNPQALLQHEPDTGRYTLLAPRVLYREGETVTAEGANNDYPLRMKRLLESVQQTAYIEVELTGF